MMHILSLWMQFWCICDMPLLIYLVIFIMYWNGCMLYVHFTFQLYMGTKNIYAPWRPVGPRWAPCWHHEPCAHGTNMPWPLIFTRRFMRNTVWVHQNITYIILYKITVVVNKNTQIHTDAGVVRLILKCFYLFTKYIKLWLVVVLLCSMWFKLRWLYNDPCQIDITKK